MRMFGPTTLVLLLACSSNGAGQPLQPAPSNPEPTASDAAAQKPKPARLTEQMATSYFDQGDAAKAAARFALEDYKGARNAFARALAGAGKIDDAQRARLRLMIAICDAELQQWEDAADGFAHAADALPLVSDYANFNAARAHYFAHDIDAAEQRARKVDAGSRPYAEAQLLIGDILRARGDYPAMAEHYERYLADRSRGPRLAEATFRLAQAYEQTNRAADAIKRYRRITIFDPLSSWAEQAQDRLDALLVELPEQRREELKSLTADEYIERGLVYFDSMRNPKSEADFAAALQAPGLTAESACEAAYHRAYSWWKERNRKKSAPLFDVAIELCDKTDNTELKVKSAYMAGRSYARLDEHEKAIERYERVEKFDHSYADDARMRQAEEYRELDDQDKVTERLSTLPDAYPDGDMRAEATWRLAWRAYKDKDYVEAIKWLNKQIEIVPIDNRWYGEGQAQYWIARSYGKLGKTDESIAAYEECVRLYPLSYYSMLALNRLREEHPKRFEALRAEIAVEPADYDPDAPAFEFQPRPLYAETGFLRGIEFLKLGLGREASLELARAGLEAPAGRDEVTDPDLVDKIWAMAWLFDRAGRYDLSHWVTRWHVLDYKRHWPVGRWRARWRIAYPLAFYDLIQAAAAKHGYPAELQMGIMREESAFDPLRESYANAIGLTQMIFPTARRFAKGTGIAVTRENLRDPEKNVTIGSNFLAFLFTTFEGRPGLMIPSYNAGEGATWRWMWERHSPDWSRDEFEEEIPGDQARNYTKRVLASYFAYAYLKDGTIPEMKQEVPLRLIPAYKVKQLKRRGKR